MIHSVGPSIAQSKTKTFHIRWWLRWLAIVFGELLQFRPFCALQTPIHLIVFPHFRCGSFAQQFRAEWSSSFWWDYFRKINLKNQFVAIKMHSFWANHWIVVFDREPMAYGSIRNGKNRFSWVRRTQLTHSRISVAASNVRRGHKHRVLFNYERIWIIQIWFRIASKFGMAVDVRCQCGVHLKSLIKATSSCTVGPYVLWMPASRTARSLSRQIAMFNSSGAIKPSQLMEWKWSVYRSAFQMSRTNRWLCVNFNRMQLFGGKPFHFKIMENEHAVARHSRSS